MDSPEFENRAEFFKKSFNSPVFVLSLKVCCSTIPFTCHEMYEQHVQIFTKDSWVLQKSQRENWHMIFGRVCLISFSIWSCDDEIHMELCDTMKGLTYAQI